MTSQPAPDRVASYGRGGAGNIGKDDPKTHTQADDLVTPTLKSEHYTTGRGGTGNIARNDPNHPEIARASQDVQAPAPREHEGPHHVGRGGAANVAKPTAEEAGAKKSEEAKGIVDKGKGLLQKIGGKKPTNGQPAA